MNPAASETCSGAAGSTLLGGSAVGLWGAVGHRLLLLLVGAEDTEVLNLP